MSIDWLVASTSPGLGHFERLLVGVADPPPQVRQPPASPRGCPPRTPPDSREHLRRSAEPAQVAQQLAAQQRGAGPVGALQQQRRDSGRPARAAREPGVLDHGQPGRAPATRARRRVRRAAGARISQSMRVRMALPDQQPGQDGQRLPSDHAGIALSLQHLGGGRRRPRPIARASPSAGSRRASNMYAWTLKSRSRPYSSACVDVSAWPRRTSAQPPQTLGEVVVAAHARTRGCRRRGRVRMLRSRSSRAASVAELQLRRAEVVVAQRGDVRVAEALGHLQRRVQQRQTFLLPVDQHQQAAEIQQCECVLGRCTRRLWPASAPARPTGARPPSARSATAGATDVTRARTSLPSSPTSLPLLDGGVGGIGGGVQLVAVGQRPGVRLAERRPLDRAEQPVAAGEDLRRSRPPPAGGRRPGWPPGGDRAVLGPPPRRRRPARRGAAPGTGRDRAGPAGRRARRRSAAAVRWPERRGDGPSGEFVPERDHVPAAGSSTPACSASAIGARSATAPGAGQGPSRRGRRRAVRGRSAPAALSLAPAPAPRPRRWAAPGRRAWPAPR